MKYKLDSILRKRQEFELGGLVWRRIPKERFMEIGKIISETDDAKLKTGKLLSVLPSKL
ncbi:hypothetical protein KEJ33_00015 [Candidatus Bathyarchaeota archaeon]|nr:hypothetical protein [Candidatus Bathyarchaeota archaeon]